MKMRKLKRLKYARLKTTPRASPMWFLAPRQYAFLVMTREA